MKSTITSGEQAGSVRTKLNNMFSDLYSFSTVSITEATSLDATAFGKTHRCSGTSSNYTIDLPTAVGNAGQSIVFKGVSALTKVVTIQPVLGQLIDGEAQRQIGATGMIKLMSDGTDWIVMDEVGSWINYTPVLTGWSSDPVIDRSVYFRVGKMVTVQVHTNANGTSNQTTKMITVPFNAGGPIQYGTTTANVNNGGTITTPGGLRTRVDSNIVDVYTSLDVSTWNGGGTGCRISFTLNYVMQ